MGIVRGYANVWFRFLHYIDERRFTGADEIYGGHAVSKKTRPPSRILLWGTFEHIFPRGQSRHYLEFLTYFKKYPALFPIGCFMYAGVYVHSLVYWFGGQGIVISEKYHVMPLYDSPVFYAFLSVIPTLVTFVVSVETSFYEKFRIYYKRVLERGTYQEVHAAKKEMQKTLIREIGFLMEVQLLFTILSIALGMRLLPRVGFTMVHLDLFIVLVLGYFLFIMLFIFMHILMYFDDRKGVLMISGSFVVINIGFTFWMMQIGNHGLGMFIASGLALGAAIARLLYVLRNIDYYTFCSQPLTTQRKYDLPRAKLGKSGAVLSGIIAIMLLLSACSDSNAAVDTQQGEVVSEADQPLVEGGLSEDKRIYEQDDDSSLKTLYVTILPDKQVNANPVDWYS
ncbi:exopolysaccharide Pel transporter PelG, partial [Paenibacillus sp. MCAF20]